MIFLAKACRHRRRLKSGEGQTFIGLSNHNYANNLGFSEALSLRDNPYPQGAYGGKNYIPISGMRRDELESEVCQSGSAIGDIIENRCVEIAKVVSQRRSEALQRILTVSFREIFRNVFEHSQSKSAVYCAQYWPSRKQVELCVGDRGIGFSASLMEDDRFSGLSDRSSLLFSLMPGVSSKAKAYSKRSRSQRSEWDNSGYGLFFAHKLFGEFGTFSMASGRHGITIRKGKLIESLPAFVEGSVVSMRLDLSDIDAIEAHIDQIRSEAHTVKARYGVNGLRLSSVEAFFRR
jgi:anti-sigma regulatory factor (Ser/Thr protein kinase)